MNKQDDFSLRKIQLSTSNPNTRYVTIPPRFADKLGLGRGSYVKMSLVLGNDENKSKNKTLIVIESMDD